MFFFDFEVAIFFDLYALYFDGMGLSPKVIGKASTYASCNNLHV